MGVRGTEAERRAQTVAEPAAARWPAAQGQQDSEEHRAPRVLAHIQPSPDDRGLGPLAHKQTGVTKHPLHAMSLAVHREQQHRMQVA